MGLPAANIAETKGGFLGNSQPVEVAHFVRVPLAQLGTPKLRHFVNLHAAYGMWKLLY